MSGFHYATAASTGGAATITLAEPDVNVAVQVIGLSYIGSGSGVGRLTVTAGTVVIIDLDVSLGNFQYLVHEYGVLNPGDALEIKLQCGAQNHTAKLSIIWQD